jgi:hypothetical protein
MVRMCRSTSSLFEWPQRTIKAERGCPKQHSERPPGRNRLARPGRGRESLALARYEVQPDISSTCPAATDDGQDGTYGVEEKSLRYGATTVRSRGTCPLRGGLVRASATLRPHRAVALAAGGVSGCSTLHSARMCYALTPGIKESYGSKNYHYFIFL